MPLFFHINSPQAVHSFENRMGRGLYGPRSGRLGAPTNTTFPTAPAAVQTFARTVAPIADFCRDRVDPGIGTYKPSIYIAGGYYRLAAIQAIVNCTPGDAPLREWMKFVRGESTDLGKVVSILTAASSMADILAGLMSGQTGATVRAVTSELKGNTGAITAEVTDYRTSLSPCPAGQGWVASRSAPGGGICMTAEQYAAFVRGVVAPLIRPNLFEQPAAAPWTFGEKFALVAAIAVVLGGGVALATR